MPTRESTPEYYKKYHASPKAKLDRAARNRCRNKAIKAGTQKKGDGKENDHIKALSNGGSRNCKKNIRVVSRKTNRSYKRNAKNRPI